MFLLVFYYLILYAKKVFYTNRNHYYLKGVNDEEIIIN